MKISNETKIGALTAIAVTLLILGFDFLKGKSLFKTGNFLYAKYTDTKELQPSNPVYINGYQIGSVYEIEPEDVNLHTIVVSIKLKDNFNIPTNSVASISSNPLGTPSIEIALGNANSYLKSEDTLISSNSGGLLNTLASKVQPIADSLKITLHSLNQVLENFNSTLDSNTKYNLKSIVSNLNKTTSSFASTASSLKRMMDENGGAIPQSIDSLKSFTKNLASNNSNIDSLLANLKNVSGKFANSNIDSAINNLKTSTDKLKDAMTKLDSNNGTIGALLNEKTLYNNLTTTITSLHLLMDDLRVHPKRYVNISVFGKKDKGDYLTSPLNTDSTANTK